MTITEENTDIIEKWFSDGKKQTLATLPEFLNSLMVDYEHDYGTICKAMSAGAMATMWAMNKEKQGGITEFQANAIMWENILNWVPELKGKPLRLVDYSKMMYPQYEKKYDKTISISSWKYLQDDARRKIELVDEYVPPISPIIEKHWQSILSGVVPFGYTVTED